MENNKENSEGEEELERDYEFGGIWGAKPRKGTEVRQAQEEVRKRKKIAEDAHVEELIIEMKGAEISYPGKDLEAMSFAENYHWLILRLFRPFIGERVAEVEAGKGSFSSLILEAGPKDLVVLEPSTEMYPLLKKRFEADGRVVPSQETLKEAAPRYSDHFDSVIYVNVLEHIQDDGAELARVFTTLKPGGHICIFVPALPFLFSDFDASVGHFRRYTRSSLKRVIENAGFTIVKLSFFDIAGIIPWFIIFKLLKRRVGSGSVSFYDKLVVPVMGVVERFIPIPVGKNLVAVGRK